MGFWLKSFLFLTLLIALAYGTFMVPLAGKPLSGHVSDVWNSPVMQAKIRLIKRSISEPSHADKKTTEMATTPSPRLREREAKHARQHGRPGRAHRDLQEQE